MGISRPASYLVRCTPRLRLRCKQPPMQRVAPCCEKKCENTSETHPGVWPDGKENEKGRFRCQVCNRWRKALNDAQCDADVGLQFKSFSAELQESGCCVCVGIGVWWLSGFHLVPSCTEFPGLMA